MRPLRERALTDEIAIGNVAQAYIESWLDGDGERMRSTLHPMLAKRGLEHGPDATPGLQDLDTDYIVASAARGPRPQYKRDVEVTILDLAHNVASVKVLSEPFVDYLHLAKIDGRWWIVNVLYEDRVR
jgi:Putative lumazine-binding